VERVGEREELAGRGTEVQSHRLTKELEE